MKTTARILLMAVATGHVASLPARAQQAPPSQAASPPTAAAEAEAGPPPAYAYSREGRRDPFLSLVGRAGDGRAPGSRPAGLPGILINELSVKGIVKQTEGFAALMQGPDKKTYVVRPGQRLLDGSIKSITSDAVVFSQDVSDPLSMVKQREVRKTLRTSEEGQG